MPYSSLSTLYSVDFDPDARLAAYDNVYAFRAKGCAVFYNAILLVSSFKGCFLFPLENQSNSRRFSLEGLDVTHDARVAICAVSRLIDVMTSYRQRICPTFNGMRNETDHDGTLVLSMTLAYGALIQLLHLFSDEDADSYQQRFGVAQACARLAAEACQVDMNLLTLTVLLPWHSAYEVLEWELNRLAMSGHTGKGAADVRADLDGLMGAYINIAKHYSFSFKQKLNLRTLARFSIHPEFTRSS